ncbi:MAG: hypothetical protein ABI625_06325 [bacterium]
MQVDDGAMQPFALTLDKLLTHGAKWHPQVEVVTAREGGRCEDLIKSGGEWINPAEIEALVNALPGVTLSAVIGRSHQIWGERPILVVQTRGTDPVDDEALLAPLRGKLASWWLPDEIIRVPRMYLSPTGKIDKAQLRAEFGSNT